MKRSYSLRTRLIITMLGLLIFQIIVVAVGIKISRVFEMLDEESFRIFSNSNESRTKSFNSKMGLVVSNLTKETLGLTEYMQDNIEDKNLNIDSELYNEFAFRSSKTLINLLKNTHISGAFIILENDKSTHTSNAHKTIYIKNSTPGTYNESLDNLILDYGPIEISKEYKIPTSIDWDLDLHFFNENPERYNFYTEPIRVTKEFPKSEIERYGYWQYPVTALGNASSLITYTMPLLKKDGSVYGVIGIEISYSYFKKFFIAELESIYSDSFYTITSAQNDELKLDWFITDNPLADIRLRTGNNIRLRHIRDSMYKSDVLDFGNMYCSVHMVNMYSKNSPFINDNWYFTGFVPAKSLHESSKSFEIVLLITLATNIVVSIFAILFLVYITTRPIVNLSNSIKSSSNANDNIKFNITGIREIDELTSKIEKLNQSVIDSSKSIEKMLQMTSLPIGGFEIRNDSEYVILTKYICKLLDINPDDKINLVKWEEYYKELTKEPAERYDDIYKFYKTEDGIKNKFWLKILRTETNNGCIGVVIDESRDIEENRRLSKALDLDAMTKLYNRNAFRREVHFKILSDSNSIGAMLFFDLDNLKYTNDTYGHEMGNKLIKKAAQMFSEFGIYGGIVSRISGDEFACYIHGYNSEDEIRNLINEQVDKFQDYCIETPYGTSLKIRYSAGLSWYPKDSDNVADLLKLADFAMYEAKHNEKGTLKEFSRKKYNEKAFLLNNREEINKLLDEGLIKFAFQPIVDLKTGKIFAYEALMRPMTDSFSSPMEILSVAATQFKLPQLEKLVINKVFETVDLNVDKFDKNINIFINSIPNHLMNNKDIDNLREKYGYLFNRIVIEVTETESIALEELKNNINSIRNSGMRLAIDDFGTGHSSEVRVLTVMPDIVKIDMALVQGIHKNLDKQKLVENLISFCQSKKVSVVAEGVEDSDDLEQLIKMKVDYVQGYYTCRPDFDFPKLNPDIVNEILELNKKYI